MHDAARIRVTEDERRALRTAAGRDDRRSVAAWLLELARIARASGLRLEEIRERLAKS